MLFRSRCLRAEVGAAPRRRRRRPAAEARRGAWGGSKPPSLFVGCLSQRDEPALPRPRLRPRCSPVRPPLLRFTQNTDARGALCSCPTPTTAPNTHPQCPLPTSTACLPARQVRERKNGAAPCSFSRSQPRRPQYGGRKLRQQPQVDRQLHQAAERLLHGGGCLPGAPPRPAAHLERRRRAARVGDRRLAHALAVAQLPQPQPAAAWDLLWVKRGGAVGEHQRRRRQRRREEGSAAAAAAADAAAAAVAAADTAA